MRQTDTFRIRSGFPRLIEADLPAGVGGASYQLSLAACAAFFTTAEILSATLTARVGTVGTV